MKKRFTITSIVFLVAACMSWADGFPLQFTFLDSEVNNNYAVTSLGDYYLTGIGLGVQAGFDLVPVENMGCFAAVNYGYGISRTIWVDSFQDLSFLAGASYQFELGGSFSLIPELAYGLCFHFIPGDIDRDGTDSMGTYFDQLIALSVKSAYAVSDDVFVYLRPEVKFCFESEEMQILIGYNLGSRIEL